MRHIFRILAVLFASATHPLYSEAPHVEEAIRLLNEEASFLNMRLGFDIFSTGGAFLENIDRLELAVEMPEMQLPDVKLMFSAVLINWLAAVNADEKARPYFKNYPMTADNIELRILTTDFDKTSTPEDPKVAFMFNVGNKIVYCIRDEGTRQLEPFLRETYDPIKSKCPAQY